MLVEIINTGHFMRAETQAKYPRIFPTYESRRAMLEAKQAEWKARHAKAIAQQRATREANIAKKKAEAGSDNGQ